MKIEGMRTENLQRPVHKPMQAQTMDPVASFRDVMAKALTEVNDLEKTSRGKLEDLAAGRTDNVHDVMIALEKSKTALEFTMTVRNKVIEAYKEITRMQI